MINTHMMINKMIMEMMLHIIIIIPNSGILVGGTYIWIIRYIHMNYDITIYSPSHDIKMSQSLDTFKCNLRNHIMSIN